MAERSHWWTDRWLRYLLFLYFSVSSSDCLPTYPPIYVSIYLSVCLSIYLIYLSIYLSIYLTMYLLSIYLSIYLPIFLSICRSKKLFISLSVSVCLSIYLSASLKTKLFGETSSFFEVDNIKNKASNKTSSFFELDSIKNKALRDFLQNGNFLQVWNFIFMGGQTGYFQGPHKHLALDNLWESVCGAIWARQEIWKFKNGKLSAELTASYHCVLRFL